MSLPPRGTANRLKPAFGYTPAGALQLQNYSFDIYSVSFKCITFDGKSFKFFLHVRIYKIKYNQLQL